LFFVEVAMAKPLQPYGMALSYLDLKIEGIHPTKPTKADVCHLLGIN